MEKQEKLTMEFVKSLMDESYTLVWVDYRDNLDNSLDTIRKCLKEGSSESLLEKVDEWYSDAEWEAVRDIISKLKDECVCFHDLDEEAVEQFFGEHEDEIREEIYSRNDSDVITELIRHTYDIPVRVEMLSDYDCINSHWYEGGSYRYEGSYFGDMVDALNLNPARVKKLLTDHGYKTYGRFPNRKSRNGKEQVSYEQFYQELVNSCCGANLLTYIGRVSLKDLYNTGFSLEEVTIPKGNCCGIFSSIFGGGSLLGMELKQDVRLKLGFSGRHGFRFQLDNETEYAYSIKCVYGVCDSFFGGAVGLVAS